MLTGSTKKNRALVTASAKKLLAAEKNSVARWRDSCAPAPSGATIAVTRVAVPRATPTSSPASGSAAYGKGWRQATTAERKAISTTFKVDALRFCSF